MGRVVPISVCKPGDASRAAWDTGLCLLVGNTESSAHVSISMKSIKYFESQGSGRVLFKITGQVLIHFPPVFQAVLCCALAGWFEHIADATSRAFPPWGYFPPDQSGRFKL